MFKKEKLIYDLLCTYHTLWLNSIDSEIGGMTKVINYSFDERTNVCFEVSADDYDKILEIIKYIEKGEIEK